MLQTAENVARRYDVSRQQQDEFAALSQQKAAAAQKEGRFSEIVPTPATRFTVQADGTYKRETALQEFDDGVRAGTTVDVLAGLRPVFAANGSVTAGNSSQTTDGAAATLLMSEAKVKELGIADDMLKRAVNVGFSGGEKKRNEMLQMAMLEPRLALLDETDSGLDIDALKTVADGVNALRSPERSMLIITHYNRLLEELRPDVVHVFVDGVIQESGGAELATELEETGYDRWIKPIETGVSLGGLGGLGGSDDPFADPFA